MEGYVECNTTTPSLPTVLILGHSFVRRMKDFLNNNVRNQNFDLQNSTVVRLLGNGGRILRFDLPAIKEVDLDILLLEIGSNDLCDPSVDPETLSETIIAFVELLQKEIKQNFTIIFQVIPRLEPPFTVYNLQARKLNKSLRITESNSAPSRAGVKTMISKKSDSDGENHSDINSRNKNVFK